MPVNEKRLSAAVILHSSPLSKHCAAYLLPLCLSSFRLMRKRVLVSLLSLAMVLTLLPAAAFAANGETQTDVSYIDAETGETRTCDSAAVLTSDTSTWNNAWYICASNTTIETRIEVSGTVNLILGDGATLDAKKGIHVPVGATLIVHGQADGTGNLNAKGETLSDFTSSKGENGENGYAGIGGDTSMNNTEPQVVNFGTIKLGATGIITAVGGERSAGIGGGGFLHNYQEVTGKIYIYRGTVDASCVGGYGSSIGPGVDCVDKTELTISGGVIYAEDGIGGDYPHRPDGGTTSTGTFSTGENGNAVIITSKFQNITQPDDTMSGVIFLNRTGTIYGDGEITLTEKNIVIPDSYTLKIENGKELAVAEGASLTNNGTISNEGTLTVSGTLTNNQIMQNQGALTVDGTLHNTSAVKNEGTLTVSGALHNDGILNNIGNDASIGITGQGSVAGSGAVYNQGGTVDGSIPVSDKTAENIAYLDERGTSQTAASATVVVDQTEWSGSESNGWYYAKNSTVLDSVQINGDVKLILGDSAVLGVSSISLSEGDSLTIYGQTTGTGVLKFSEQINGYKSAVTINGGVIQNSSENNYYDGALSATTLKINAGTVNSSIGSEWNGKIEINGGIINGTIGGRGSGGAIVINGGVVNADSSGQHSPEGNFAISGSSITINGGEITATAAEEEPIGDRINAIYGDQITITGGKVTATATSTAEDPYAGANAIRGGTIAISGGTVTATATGKDSNAIFGEELYADDDNSGNISISGGTVTATATGENSCGINAENTISTGKDGNAVIFASSIKNDIAEETSSGVIFEGSSGQVYSSPTVTTDFTIPADINLMINVGQSLKLTEDATVTVSGDFTGNITLESGAGAKLNNDL